MQEEPDPSVNCFTYALMPILNEFDLDSISGVVFDQIMSQLAESSVHTERPPMIEHAALIDPTIGLIHSYKNPNFYLHAAVMIPGSNLCIECESSGKNPTIMVFNDVVSYYINSGFAKKGTNTAYTRLSKIRKGLFSCTLGSK